MINYDDFSKIELKIGKVIKAERVEGAEKLLKLEVDFGTEKRQIISGIAKASARRGSMCDGSLAQQAPAAYRKVRRATWPPPSSPA